MLSRKLLATIYPWNGFPRGMRYHFVAQAGRCPYCKRPLLLDNDRDSQSAATWDHVFPAALGGTLEGNNGVLAHAGCNQRKKDRIPYPCELLFGRITNDIVVELAGWEAIPRGRRRRQYQALV